MLNFSTKQLISVLLLFLPITLLSKDSSVVEDVTGYIIEAKKKVFENKPEEARQFYLKAIKLDSMCDVCYYDISNLYLRANKYQLAYNMASKAYGLDTTNNWYAILFARLSFMNRDYKAAEKVFEKLLVRERNSQEIWMNLSSIYEEMGNTERALNLIDSIQHRFGESDNLTYRRYDLFIREGNFTKALEEAKVLEESNSDDIRFVTILADTYSQVNDIKNAIATYNKALEMDSNFPPAAIGKAETYRKDGQFDLFFKSLQDIMSNKKIDDKTKSEYLGMVVRIPSFAQYFKKDLDTIFAITSSVSPASIELTFLQAAYFGQTERIMESLSLLRTVISMDNKNHEAWDSLLSILYSMNMWDELKKESEEAIKILPYHKSFYLTRALAFSQTKKEKEAIKTLNEAIRNSDLDSIAYSAILSFRADLYQQIDKHKKAVQDYIDAIKYDPLNAGALNNYAYMLSLQNKNIDQAYEMSKKAIEIESNNVSFLDTYAYILYLQGRYSEAKTYFRQAISKGGNNSAVVLDHYADTLYKLGEFSTAEIYWSQALEKEDCTNHKEIKEKLKKLKK